MFSFHGVLSIRLLIPHSGFNSPQLAANFKRIFKFDTPSACGGAVYLLFFKFVLLYYECKQNVFNTPQNTFKEASLFFYSLFLSFYLVAGRAVYSDI